MSDLENETLKKNNIQTKKKIIQTSKMKHSKTKYLNLESRK